MKSACRIFITVSILQTHTGNPKPQGVNQLGDIHYCVYTIWSSLLSGSWSNASVKIILVSECIIRCWVPSSWWLSNEGPPRQGRMCQDPSREYKTAKIIKRLRFVHLVLHFSFHCLRVSLSWNQVKKKLIKIWKILKLRPWTPQRRKPWILLNKSLWIKVI